MLMAALTFPDVKRGPPIPVPADAPVLNILQPVPEPSFSDAFGDPVDSIVVADQILLHGSHLNKP